MSYFIINIVDFRLREYLINNKLINALGLIVIVLE